MLSLLMAIGMPLCPIFLLSCHSNILISCRSPSPPPQYDNFGRRVNTREYRYRKRLEDERHKLIEKAMKAIPNYHPPQDYRRPTKTQEKVYVPVNDYPEINFSMIANPRFLTFLTSNLAFKLNIFFYREGDVFGISGGCGTALDTNPQSPFLT